MTIYELVDFIRSNRAPRGKAAERKKLLSEALTLREKLIDLGVLIQGTGYKSTYQGIYPETAGVAYENAKAQVSVLERKFADLLGV